MISMSKGAWKDDCNAYCSVGLRRMLSGRTLGHRRWEPERLLHGSGSIAAACAHRRAIRAGQFRQRRATGYRYAFVASTGPQ